MTPEKLSESKSTKERILDYSRQRFFDEGFQTVSMDEIAAGLGISKKTFYKYFPSKEDLLRQVAERTMAEARLMFHRLLISDMTFIEKIDRFSVLVGTQLSRISRALARDIRRSAPGLWTAIERFREERIQQNFSLLFEQGVREGFVRPEVNKRIFLLSYRAAINTIMNPTLLADEPFSFQEAMHGIVSIFFRGILTGEGNRRMAELEQSRVSQQR